MTTDIALNTVYGVIHCNPYDTHQYPTLLATGRPIDDPLIHAFFDLLPKPGPDDVFVDGGACYGTWTMAAIHYGFRHVHAYEPQPHARELLERTISGIKLDVRVQSRPLGTPGDVVAVPVYRPDSFNNFGGVELGPRSPEVLAGEVLRHETASAVALPEEASALKLDVEGMEMIVLAANREMLTARKPPMVIEVIKSDRAQIHEYVKVVLGYKWVINTPNDVICLP